MNLLLSSGRVGIGLLSLGGLAGLGVGIGGSGSSIIGSSIIGSSMIGSSTGGWVGTGIGTSSGLQIQYQILLHKIPGLPNTK